MSGKDEVVLFLGALAVVALAVWLYFRLVA